MHALALSMISDMNNTKMIRNHGYLLVNRKNERMLGGHLGVTITTQVGVINMSIRAYFLTTYPYKCMCLTTRVYGSTAESTV